MVAIVIVGGLKLQLLSDGKPLHIAGESVTLPALLNPFWAVKVSVVDPDCPGAATLIVVGFAATVKVGPVTVKVAKVGVVAPR